MRTPIHRKIVQKHFLKQIDIVIHIAGGGLGLKDKLIINEDLLTLLLINLGAAAEINRIVVSGKSKSQSLKLVHVGSIASNEAVASVGYNVAKSALSTYVKSLGRELYKNNVIVTGILPGGFIAPGNAMERLRKKNIIDYKKFIKTRLPRGLMGNVKEVLPMLLFLCSKHSSMMGGCLVPMDAGEGRAYQIWIQMTFKMLNYCKKLNYLLGINEKKYLVFYRKKMKDKYYDKGNSKLKKLIYKITKK